MCQIRNGSIVVALLVLFASARHTFAQDNELRSIATRVQTLKKVVNDKYVSEQELRKVGDELDDMLARTNELARGLAEQNVSRSLIAVQEQILPLLAFIRERLPEEESRDAPVRRRAPRAGIGVPQFESRKLIGRLAGEAAKAHYRLSRHLAKSNPDKATTDKLLVEMILAEEALAWEVGWPFTAGEVTKLKAAGGGMTEEVYLGRRDRGLERINERVRTEHESVGRTPPPPFVIHHPIESAVAREVTEQIRELRGIDGSWEKGTTAFDDHEQLVLLGKKRRKQPETEADEKESSDPEKKTASAPSLDELLPKSPKPKKRIRPAPKTDAKPRAWSDKSGKFQVEATFVSLIGGKVRLKRKDNGKTIELELAELSEADRQYVESLK